MEKLDCCVQGKGHSKILKCQWMFVQILFSESLNLFAASLWARLSFKKIGLLSSRTVKDNIVMIWLFNMLSELLILLQLNFVWWYIIIRWIVFWKDWIALLWSKSRSQKKIQNFSECSSGQYLLSCWTFCNQTWYCDATLWANVSCKKIGLLSSSSGSQWGLMRLDMTVSAISTELLIFLQPKFSIWLCCLFYHDK